MRLEFRMLGPVEVSVDGVSAPLGGIRQRAVLAMLLAHANEVVPVERLIDGVWADAPPESAANVLQGHVSHLRKVLGRDTIATRGSGYAVVVADGALDVHRFERFAAAGAGARGAGRHSQASADLDAALALWRGPALSDLTGLPAVRPIAQRLDELRLSVLERRIEADLDCGREAEAAADADVLIAAHPLRERFRALRMLALYRCGRQAEALEAFRVTRATLVEELGIEPSAELQDLERAILRQDPALTRPMNDRSSSQGGGVSAGTVLVAAFATDALEVLAAVGEPLARRQERELVLAATTPRASELAVLTARLRELSRGVGDRGVTARFAAFTSVAPGADLCRMASEQNADLVLIDGPPGLLEDAQLLSLLDVAPCDVAVVVGDALPGAGPVLVPFSGSEHDWAAVELGARLAQSLPRRLQLAGASTGASGRDASRMLASVSLAVQRALGVHAEPIIVDPSPPALVDVAREAGVVLFGLTDRWRREGLGRTRTALTDVARVPTLLVRCGMRPGGLAPRAGETHFTWTITVPT